MVARLKLAELKKIGWAGAETERGCLFMLLRGQDWD